MYLLFLGLEREVSQGGNTNNCNDKLLQTKINVNLPLKYTHNVFCGQNPTEDEATCPGDSGKNLSLKLTICILILFTATYFHLKMYFALESIIIVKNDEIINKTEVQLPAMSKIDCV